MAETKYNLLNALDDLREGNINNIPSQFTFPLIRWLCGVRSNIQYCNEANIGFLKAKPKYILSYLHIHMNKYIKRFRYPKASKEKFAKLDIAKKYLMKLYKWSSIEFDKHKSIVYILLEQQEFINDLNAKVRFEKIECKIMGIKYAKIKKEKFQKIQTKSLFDFN